MTRTSSPISSSITAPKMMLASWWATAWMISAASLTSSKPRSVPPLMLSRIPRAFSIEASSNGLEMAERAAETARPSPLPCPMPMRALPASVITVRTSAKSVLMRPGVVMRVVIPCTPWRSTSSAILKALSTDVFASDTDSSRSLGITISVSTFSLSFWIPASACTERRRPSKANGRVTTPMVSAPSDFATSAITGAAPVPVPPPLPAVMNTMSAPRRDSRISSMCSSAAVRPISGSLPAPRPRVRSRPMSSFSSASLISSAWASVFAAMNSTPFSPASIMRLTALTPPPPTPMTLMTAR